MTSPRIPIPSNVLWDLITAARSQVGLPSIDHYPGSAQVVKAILAAEQLFSTSASEASPTLPEDKQAGSENDQEASVRNVVTQTFFDALKEIRSIANEWLQDPSKCITRARIQNIVNVANTALSGDSPTSETVSARITTDDEDGK